MKHARSMPGRHIGRFLRSGATVLVLACLLGNGGCRSSTEPDIAPSPYTFLPTGVRTAVYLGSYRDFAVEGAGESGTEIVWTRAGGPAGIGTRYRYWGQVLEDEELRVDVSAGGRTTSHRWRVNLVPGDRILAEFAPAEPSPLVFAGMPRNFSVTSAWGDPAVAWNLDGAHVGDGPEFTLEPEGAGPQSLGVAVVLGDTLLEHVWWLNVRPAADALPGAVLNLTAVPGSVRGEIRLEWQTPPSLSPVSHYEIRIDTDGPVTETTWPDLPALPLVFHRDGDRSYVAVLPSWLTGLEGGETAWCCVRARNGLDLLSPVRDVETVVVDGRWWVSGTVRDLSGSPLAGVDVTAETGISRAVTAADGTYTIGPFEDGERPVLRASTPAAAPAGESWSAELSAVMAPDAPRAWDFHLLPRYGCDPACPAFGGNFVAFLRTLTNTLAPTEFHPHTRLYRWETYPVPVHVPEFTGAGGVDYGAACRAVIAVWNDNLGDAYLTLVDDPDLADIGFFYDLTASTLSGQAVLVEPPGYDLGETIPEFVALRLRPDLPGDLAVQAVALHELGHALGITSHIFCNDAAYLMRPGGINPFETPPAEAIHLDEIRLVRTIRDLPQGAEMAFYPTAER